MPRVCHRTDVRDQPQPIATTAPDAMPAARASHTRLRATHALPVGGRTVVAQGYGSMGGLRLWDVGT